MCESIAQQHNQINQRERKLPRSPLQLAVPHSLGAYAVPVDLPASWTTTFSIHLLSIGAVSSSAGKDGRFFHCITCVKDGSSAVRSSFQSLFSGMILSTMYCSDSCALMRWLAVWPASSLSRQSMMVLICGTRSSIFSTGWMDVPQLAT